MLPLRKAADGKSTGMIIDGVAASEAIDSSGEILDVKGCDISSFENGDGLLNWEHRNEENKGASANDIVGHIIYAKKIFKAEDCGDRRQKMYWDMVKLPFIYIKARLYDGAGHPNAIALAAQIRDHVQNNEKVLCRYSIEGSTLKKDGNHLARSIARKVAVTVKPCNKSCHSGVVLDPNSPFEGDKKSKTSSLIESILARSEGLVSGRLGASTTVAFNPMVNDKSTEENVVSLLLMRSLSKALTAGGAGGAPSTLTGGAALAPEHLSRWKGVALAAIRDYDKPSFKKEEFKAFLKFRLPEADDNFIDHFSDLADDFNVKRSALRKAEEEKAEKKPRKKAEPKAKASEPATASPSPKKPSAKPAKAKVTTEAAPAVEAPASTNLTPSPTASAGAPVVSLGEEPMSIRGAAVQGNPHLSKPFFDEGTGILHTPKGSFPMYIPSRDPDPRGKESFHRILDDPKVTAFHDRAMDNWSKVNGLLRAGQLPPEVIMHGTLFSQLSPNTPVPIQELMYGHLVDSMRHTGIDARDPQFGSVTGKDWLGRDRGDSVPELSRDYFNKLGPQVRIGKQNPDGSYYSNYNIANSPNAKRQLAEGRVPRGPGDMQSFMLANNKLVNMSKYHTLHQSLSDLVNRHRDNARGAIQELMAHKEASKKHEAKRGRAMNSGAGDIGPYPGPDVPGLAPKTGRYMYGMLGGSNVVVPDTHFVRHLFGLSKDTDQPTIDHLKETLWNPGNTEIMNSIDRYYAQHHDAVEHMKRHPRFGGLFHDRESAIFPAFWKHWMSIVPHEQARGIKTFGLNADTDHTPYWEAVDPYVRKSEDEDARWRLPSQTAQQQAQWIQQYGELPAMTLYYRYTVPRLLQAARDREAHGAF